MKLMRDYRYGVNAAVLVAAGLMLSGCLGDPTYGTGVTQTGHLAEGLGNLVTLPKNKAADIDYKPRPGIVLPPKGDQQTLPPPQQAVASDKNPNWPESPENVRKKMEAKIDEETGNTGRLAPGASPRTWDGGHTTLATDKQTKQFREAINLEQGTYSGRRFLSDPPSGLKVPAATAPVGELGKSEKEKERERIAAAKKEGTGNSWWPF